MKTTFKKSAFAKTHSGDPRFDPVGPMAPKTKTAAGADITWRPMDNVAAFFAHSV